MACAAIASLLWTGHPLAQRSGMFQGSMDDPGINYTGGPVDNSVDRLNRRLDAGNARLTFDARSGYLKSALTALGLPVDSQLLVFSPGSLQGRRISAGNPRAIFFRDDLEVGWLRGGELIEVAAHDARQGVVFYTLQQTEVAAPRFQRAGICLGCHMTGDTAGVPGLLMFSTTPQSGRSFGSAAFMTPAMPIAKRFGGWFVTGARVPAHQGNAVAALAGRTGALASTAGLYDASAYPAASSDIAALMVFAHQAHMLNLITRASWEARVADPALHPDRPRGSEVRLAPVLRALAADVVDALLFIDDAPLEDGVQGSSGFAERFAGEGPRDSKGRSLRQLDLTRRLMRYPCSYLIYSPMFDGLPAAMKALIYERLWEVLSGREAGARYRAALTSADRRAIVEILRDTKPGLPPYFARALR